MGLPEIDNWTMAITIPSDTSIGSPLVDKLVEQMRIRGWSDRDVFQVQLAYEEAIVNAIRHGNRFAADKTVEVQFECSDQSLAIRIADQGAGFDPKNVPDPTCEERLEIPGGRGVLMIRQCMSRVTYAGNGTCLIMEKDRGHSQLDEEE
jgi:serine/threonine-protein kinase RsbW